MFESLKIAKLVVQHTENKDKAFIDNVIKKVVCIYPHKISSIIRSLNKMKELDAFEVTIITARNLSGDSQQQIINELDAEYSYPLNYNFRVQPDVGAGIIIKKGELVIDGSAKNKIKNIAIRIKYF